MVFCIFFKLPSKRQKLYHEHEHELLSSFNFKFQFHLISCKNSLPSREIFLHELSVIHFLPWFVMSTKRLISSGTTPETEPPRLFASALHSFRQCVESARVFEELPIVSIVSVSRPDTGDISPLLLSYTIEIQYKQVFNRTSLSILCFDVFFILLRKFWRLIC